MVEVVEARWESRKIISISKLHRDITTPHPHTPPLKQFTAILLLDELEMTPGQRWSWLEGSPCTSCRQFASGEWPACFQGVVKTHVCLGADLLDLGKVSGNAPTQLLIHSKAVGSLAFFTLFSIPFCRVSSVMFSPVYHPSPSPVSSGKEVSDPGRSSI